MILTTRSVRLSTSNWPLVTSYFKREKLATKSRLFETGRVLLPSKVVTTRSRLLGLSVIICQVYLDEGSLDDEGSYLDDEGSFSFQSDQLPYSR